MPGSKSGRYREYGRLPEKICRASLRSPKVTIALWILGSVLGVAGLLHLGIETTTGSVLDREHDAWAFYERSQAQFGGDEIVSLLIECKSRFSRDCLDDIRYLTDSLEEIDFVSRVDSLASVPLIRTDSDGSLRLDAGLRAALPDSDADFRRLIDEIRSDRIARNTLVSADGRSVAINVILDPKSDEHYGEILQAINAILGSQEAWISGVPVFRIETDSWTQRELFTFVPATVFVVGLCCFLFFRNFTMVLVALASSAAGSVILLGVMGGLGVPLTISTSILPSILLALGCAYAMHFLTAISIVTGVAEFEKAIENVVLPIALSGLTTALGFLAIALVRIQAVREIGTFGALGVLLVLLATLTLVPAIMVIVPIRPHRKLKDSISHFFARIVIAPVANHRRVTIGLWFLAAGLVGVGISRLEVQTDVILWFPKEDKIRIAYDIIRERLSGISPMNVVINAAAGQSVVAPEALAAIDNLETYLRSLDEVGAVVSIADPLREIGYALDPSGSHHLPSTRDQIAQYLLLLESEDYIEDLLSADRSVSNVMLRVNENGSDALLDLARKIDSWWSENGLDEVSVRTTGIMYEFARSEDAIARGQIRGLIMVFATIGVILLLVYRSLPLAVVAIIPNAIPIVMAFGLMGLLSVPLDAGTVVVGSIAFGIAVDDTIHVVTAFVRHSDLGAGTRSAVYKAYSDVVPALVFTTVTIALGFLILGFSRFVLIRNMGLVTSLAMVLCLMADILLLPALLTFVGRSEVRENGR